jgi:hypothetical protein
MKPGDARVVVGHDHAAPAHRTLGAALRPPPAARSEPGKVLVQPRRERDRPLGRAAGEANGAAGLLRDDLLDPRDRPPERAHDLAPLAERERAPSAPAASTESRSAPLSSLGQPVGELLERRLAQSHTKRAALASLEDLVASGPDHLRGDRLCKRSGDAKRRELRSFVGRT